WAQQISALTADATTAQTVNVTAPSAEFAMVGAEILPGAGGGGVALAGSGKTSSQGIGVFTVVNPSLQGSGSTFSKGVGTLTMAPGAVHLVGAGSNASLGL